MYHRILTHAHGNMLRAVSIACDDPIDGAPGSIALRFENGTPGVYVDGAYPGPYETKTAWNAVGGIRTMSSATARLIAARLIAAADAVDATA